MFWSSTIEIGELALLERPGDLLLVELVGGMDRGCPDGLAKREPGQRVELAGELGELRSPVGFAEDLDLEREPLVERIETAVAAERDPAAGPGDRRRRLVQIPPVPRQVRLDGVRRVGRRLRPLQAHRGGHVEGLEPLVVGGVDDLGVRDRRVGVAPPVRPPRGREGVERDADSAVPDRVDVRLDAAALEAGDGRVERRVVDVQLTACTGVGARCATRVEVRLEHRGGLARILRDAVEEDLDRVDRDAWPADELAPSLLARPPGRDRPRQPFLALGLAAELRDAGVELLARCARLVLRQVRGDREMRACRQIARTAEAVEQLHQVPAPPPAA